MFFANFFPAVVISLYTARIFCYHLCIIPHHNSYIERSIISFIVDFHDLPDNRDDRRTRIEPLPRVPAKFFKGDARARACDTV